MILITGGAGYIGSHCALNFIRNGYKTVVFDNLSHGHQETIAALQSQGVMEFFAGDLNNPADLEKVFTSYSIDAVIHFAGFIEVAESVADPAKYYRNNVAGTLNLLNAMLAHNVKRIIFSSTCAVYGEPQYVPLDEKHPHKPLNAYGASKSMVETILADYDRAYALKHIILRYFNVVGADEDALIGERHEPETHLVPNILKSVVDAGKVFTIFGTDYATPDGTCVRDYVNVCDLAEAHRLAWEYLTRENRSDVFTLGTEKGSSVKEIFDMCEKVLGTQIAVKTAPKRPGDAAVLYADSSRAKTVLGWQPQKTLADSIRSAYAWERKISG